MTHKVKNIFVVDTGAVIQQNTVRVLSTNNQQIYLRFLGSLSPGRIVRNTDFLFLGSHIRKQYKMTMTVIHKLGKYLLQRNQE